jgi:hypothetical protein
MRANLSEEGNVLIYVHACAELYSRFDVQIRHFQLLPFPRPKGEVNCNGLYD